MEVEEFFPPEERPAVEEELMFRSGTMVVKVSPSLSSSLERHTGTDGKIHPAEVPELQEIAGIIGMESLERLFRHAGVFEARSREEGMHLWYQLSFDESFPVGKARELMASHPGISVVECDPMKRLYADTVVEYASPSGVIMAGAPFNDPLLYRQWHYCNDGSREGTEPGCDINVFPLWKEGVTGREDVIVCVVDGGVDYTHEDLAGNIWQNPEAPGSCGYNFCNDSPDVTPDDHATHVAGTISALNNNGLGVCGIAGGDSARGIRGVKIMSCQIFTGNESVCSPAAAIKWGADHSAVICQNSWGYPELDETPESIKAAVDYFVKYAGLDADGIQTGPMAGGLVVFAAGNERRMASSSTYESILNVTSMGADFVKAPYSNWGSFADLAAPGGYKPNRVLSTLPGNRYGWMSGTSMACPHVSGAAALVVSACGGPGFTPAELRRRLEESARDISAFNPDHYMGHGLVDVYAAATAIP
jgi:subtilisin family serine protease